MVAYYRTDLIEIIHLQDYPIVYSEHNHVSTYTMGLVLEGMVTLNFHNTVSVYSSNDYFVIMPYQTHSLQMPDEYSFLSLCVPEKLSESKSASDLFGEIYDVLKPLFPQVNRCALKRAIELIYHHVPVSREYDKIFESAFYLRRHPESFFDVQEMAEHASYSQYHFIRTFKKSIDLTPHKFQIQNKIRIAQRLIEEETPIGKIAYELGFYAQSHFTKCFKSIMGMTPTTYKQSLVRM